MAVKFWTETEQMEMRKISTDSMMTLISHWVNDVGKKLVGLLNVTEKF